VFLLNFKQRLLRIYVEHHLEARQYTKQQPEHSGKESASNRLERKTKPRHTLEHSLNNDKQSIMHFEAAPPPKKRELRYPLATAQQMQCTETKACNVQENKPKQKKKKNQKLKTRTTASLSFRFGSRASRSQITPRREKKHHKKPQNETFQKPSKTPEKKNTLKNTPHFKEKKEEKGSTEKHLKQTNKQTNKQKLPLCTGAKKGKRVHFHL
jgi:hypothetical protein